MNHFADPYPDELLFSAWVRSAEQHGYPNRYAYFVAITGHERIKPIVDLPCHLDQFIATLPSPSSYPASTLIYRHTLYPYYCPFLPRERAQLLYETMRGENGKRVYWCTNLMNSPIPRRAWFRYCPDCVQEDRARYGECFWHRLHQIQGVLVCPAHHVPLLVCTPEQQAQAERLFIPADQVLGAEEATCSNLPRETWAMAEQIATQISFLLASPQPVVDLHQRYHQLLAQHHYLRSNGAVRITDVILACEERFSPSLLRALQCTFDLHTPAYLTWMSRLLGNRTMCQHPLLHVLAIILLEDSLEAFFRPSKTTEGVFGAGPWPCLNPACSHYRQLSITSCQVHHEGKARRTTGHFACACGFRYLRIHKQEMDPFHKDGTLEYGEVWQAKLRELWVNKEIPLNAFVRQLGVSELAIHRQAYLLGLPARTFPYISTNEERLNQRREADRQAWLTAQMEDTCLSRTQLWHKYQKLRYRLRRYDQEWFEAHPFPLPPKRSGRHLSRARKWKPKKPINWEERDSQLSDAIRQAVDAMQSPQQKPCRVTMARLTKAIPELGWLKQRRVSLYPQSRALLASVLETREQFVRRKIRWLMHQWENQHIWRGRQRFLELSGAHLLLSVPEIVQEVNQALAHLASVFPEKRVTLFS